ncbi:hypothetical protein [Streptomyces sp. NBC_00280]|uniref:hypothetical protein n=1 Tax=Streptomyces sp. NBC_00280 TaxID=2975699 RepID=UPI003253EB13
MTTHDDMTTEEWEDKLSQEREEEREVTDAARRAAAWIAAGRPCHAGGEAHTHRDFCGTCDPAATPEELAAFCDRPSPGDSGDWSCANCVGVLCAGGHTHERHPGEVCPRC